MNAAIFRNYDVIVYLNEDDCDDYCAFSITSHMIYTHTIRVFITCYNDFEKPLYLGLCDDELWFIDTEYQHGLTIPFPKTEDDVYDCIIEIDGYDEEQCAVLSETIFLLYQDILKPCCFPNTH